MSGMAMDFFSHQDRARRRTGLLIGYYALAVVLIILAVYLAFALLFLVAKGEATSTADVAARWWNPELFLWVVGGTAAVVAVGTLFKISQLSGGGAAIASMLGGRPVNGSTKDPDERKILNVVEEMAIASGTPVPPVYLMAEEDGINAFAAGFSPQDAVIGVTRGCIQRLTRDELQGVIAHEFSHILNGDMRLNIRLIGILNGILVIGLAGYFILRTAGSSHRSSREDKGRAGIAVLGLLLMVIGFVGVFFGRLIKAAVSRQREFLADASAVQFTRNPSGIGGALKKIMGFSAGSCLATGNAEEASHFFFANGLRSSMAGLLATHPPLDERIQRIDAGFVYERAEAVAAARVGQGVASVSGFAAGTAVAEAVAVEPDAVISSVGAPTPEHVAYASRLIDGFPSAVLDAVREPFGARAVVYGLLLNREAGPRKIQIQTLQINADPAVYMATVKLADDVAASGREAFLSLLDMAISALRELSPSQYETFIQNVDALVRADDQIDLFEYALQRVLRRHLDPLFGRSRTSKVKYQQIKRVLPQCVDLLSCLAYWGTDEIEAARRAFGKGVQKLGTMVPELRSAETCGLNALDGALDVLVLASPSIKRQVIDACVRCVADDGYVTVEEAELLRAVGDSLECPIPPMLPGDVA